MLSVVTIVLCCVALFVAGVLTGFGGGAGTLMAGVGTIFVGPHEGVVFAGVVMLIAQMSWAVPLRREIQWPLVWPYAIPAMIGAAVGARLLFLIPREIAEVILGLVCVVFVVQQLRRKRVSPSPPYLITGVQAFFGGMLGAMVRGASAIRSNYLLTRNLENHPFVATGATIACLQLITQMCVYSTQVQWRQDFFLPLMSAVVFVPLGARVGRFILSGTPKKIFKWSQILVIAVTGSYILISLGFR